MNLAPSTASPGQSVTVSGSATRKARARLFLGDISLVADFTVPANGRYSKTVAAPTASTDVRLETLRSDGVWRQADSARLTVTTQPAPTPTPSPAVPSGAFLAEYFANKTLTAPAQGTATVPAITFDWGAGAPGGLPVDNFSIRYRGRFPFEAKEYQFTVRADDGVRVFIDDALLIAAWQDQPPTTFTARKVLTAGEHEIKVEYYELAGGSLLNLAWAVAAAPAPEPVPTPPGTNPSGVPLVAGNIPAGVTATNAGGFPWIEVHRDDFIEALGETQWPHGLAAVDARWDFYPEIWHDTSGNGWYGNRVISTRDSVMRLHQRFLDGKWRSAAPIPVPNGGAIGGTSWRVESRYRSVIPGVGFGPAWLLWPTSNVWPRDGECDGPEGQFHAIMEAYMHRQNATTGSDQDHRTSGKTYTDWHTWISEWIMGQWWAVYCDGQLLAPPVTSRVPATPMRYVMQTETRLSGGPPAAGAEALLEIDWVKCYRKG